MAASAESPRVVLQIRSRTAEVDAILRMLEYGNVAHRVEVHSGAEDAAVTLRVARAPEQGEGADEEAEEDDRIDGWEAVFHCVSRWTHTFPSNGTDAGVLLARQLALERSAVPYDDLERLLHEHGGPWVASDLGFEQSTCLDFLWLCRVRQAASAAEDDELLASRPALAAFARLDAAEEASYPCVPAGGASSSDCAIM